MIAIQKGDYLGKLEHLKYLQNALSKAGIPVNIGLEDLVSSVSGLKL